ncbi:hypothetical protein, partial [Rhodococcus rhodochrous]|uniref:hypothetical protein n=1 Tax=Rhodococcus rhodochrous TaxID=1829 RepID=UPI00210CE60F
TFTAQAWCSGGNHDEHEAGTFIWPPVGTVTRPPVGTFSWPWTATSVLEYFEASLDIIQVAANIEGGMVGCSFGSLPAAQRLARRFGIEPIVLRDRFLLSSRVAFDDSRLASRPVTVTTGVTVTDPTPDPTGFEWTDFDDLGTTRQHYQVRTPDGTVLGRFRLGTTGRDGDVVAELDQMEIVLHRLKDGFDSTASVVRGAAETAWQHDCVASKPRSTQRTPS